MQTLPSSGELIKPGFLIKTLALLIWRARDYTLCFLIHFKIKASMAGEDGEGLLSEGVIQSGNVSRLVLVDHYLLRRLTGRDYPDQ